MRKRVTLLQNTGATVDAAGAPLAAWTVVATIWAEIIPQGGQEFWQGQQSAAQSFARIRIRFNPMVQPQMRIGYGSRTFQIVNVSDVDERHIEMLLDCRELAP